MLVATIQHNAYCTWLAALVIVTVSKDCTHAAHFRAVINILAAKFNSLPSPSLSLPTPTRLALSLNAPSITASGFIKPADSLLPKWRMKVSSLPASGFPFLMPLTKVCRALFCDFSSSFLSEKKFVLNSLVCDAVNVTIRRTTVATCALRFGKSMYVRQQGR